MRYHHLAKAAYAAYAESLDWRDASGTPLPQFSSLPEAQQRAWANGADATLKEWLDTNFRRSLQDRARVAQSFVVQLHTGLTRGDDICVAASVAMASYVMDLIDPLAAQRSQIE